MVSGADSGDPGAGPARRAIARLLFGLLLLMVASASVAHRLQVFAAADGSEIQGRAYFVGGHPARAVAIQVLDGEGKPVAELKSDAEGRFRVNVSAAQDYLIVADAADGHRAEWPISAAEWVGPLDEPGAAGADGLAEPSPSASSAAHSGDGRQGSGRVERSATIEGSSLADASGSARSASSTKTSGGADGAPLEAEAEPASRVEPSARDALCLEDTKLERVLSAAIERSVEQAVARQLRPLREALAEAQARVAFRDLLGGLGYIAGLAGLGLWWTRRRRPSGADDADG